MDELHSPEDAASTSEFDCDELERKSSTHDLIKSQMAAQNNCYFGCWSFHPRWLQVLACAKFYTFWLCVETSIEGALVSGFSSVSISSIERRFQLNSTAVGFLLVSFDLSVLLCVIFISYFGDKGHKPRWIGYGAIFQGLGALIFALPQFVFGSYEIGITGNLTLQACELLGEAPTAACDGNSNILAYFIILLGNIFIGIGAAPLFTIGISFIDDITLPKYVPVHLGALYVCLAFGPALGYALGGVFLSIYVDPWVDTRLTETDPGWVGAWWIGFVICGVLSLLVAPPFFLFPRKLSNFEEVMKVRKSEQAKTYVSKLGEEKSFKNQLKAFPRHLLDLFKSPSFVFVTLGISFLFLTLYGLVSFGPKFIESVFNIPASTSSLLAGAVAIPAGGLGTIVGAIITFFLKSKPKKVSILLWFSSLLVIPPIFGFFVTCPSLEVAGITGSYANNSVVNIRDITISSCNADCMCTSSVYEPVCGADNITYFSPCRAGCMKRPDENDSSVSVFYNCTCIADSLLRTNSSLYGEGDISMLTATDGKCPQDCNKLVLWLFLIGVVVFLIFVMRVPTLLVAMRAVADEQRSLALAVQSVVWRAIGSIPGPLLFGVIFDTSCLYWQEECGRRGNCWVYNNDNISTRAFSVSMTGVCINTIFMILCWIFYPPVPCTKQSPAEFSDQAEGPLAAKKVSNPVYQLELSEKDASAIADSEN